MLGLGRRFIQALSVGGAGDWSVDPLHVVGVVADEHVHPAGGGSLQGSVGARNAGSRSPLGGHGNIKEDFSGKGGQRQRCRKI